MMKSLGIVICLLLCLSTTFAFTSIRGSDDACADKECSGHGSCSEGVCTCDNYWLGNDCEEEDACGPPDQLASAERICVNTLATDFEWNTDSDYQAQFALSADAKTLYVSDLNGTIFAIDTESVPSEKTTIYSNPDVDAIQGLALVPDAYCNPLDHSEGCLAFFHSWDNIDMIDIATGTVQEFMGSDTDPTTVPNEHYGCAYEIGVTKNCCGDSDSLYYPYFMHFSKDGTKLFWQDYTNWMVSDLTTGHFGGGMYYGMPNPDQVCPDPYSNKNYHGYGCDIYDAACGECGEWGSDYIDDYARGSVMSADESIMYVAFNYFSITVVQTGLECSGDRTSELPVDSELVQDEIVGMALSANDAYMFLSTWEGNSILKYNMATEETEVILGSVSGHVDGEGTGAKFELTSSLLLSPDGNRLYIMDADEDGGNGGKIKVATTCECQAVNI